MTATLLELGLSIENPNAYVPMTVTGRITAVTHDAAKVTLRDGTVGIIPVTEFYPDRRWVVGEQYTLLRLDGSTSPVCSTVRPELVTGLLAGASPEIRDGRVRVMAVAREPGKRCKVAVAATVEDLDPIAACVGKRANRSRVAVSDRLCGEKVDLIAWDPDTAVYLRNALKPAEVHDVIIKGSRATAIAPKHQMSAAVGENGVNSSLAGSLLGVTVTIVAEGSSGALEALQERIPVDVDPENSTVQGE
jgi:transcription termination/antitermination protein NusA